MTKFEKIEENLVALTQFLAGDIEDFNDALAGIEEIRDILLGLTDEQMANEFDITIQEVRDRI